MLTIAVDYNTRFILLGVAVGVHCLPSPKVRACNRIYIYLRITYIIT